MKKKIAAIVIAYHPQADELEKNMLAYMDAVDLVLVWRNSPEALPFNEKRLIKKAKNSRLELLF